MTNFHDTEGGAFASLAKEHFEGALVLDRAQGKRGKILFRPTLFLAGQGLELMLKGCSVWNGQEIKRRGPAGHDINAMWQSDACEPVRGHTFVNAIRLAAEYRDSGMHPDVVAEEDVIPTIDEYVRARNSSQRRRISTALSRRSEHDGTEHSVLGSNPLGNGGRLREAAIGLQTR